MNCSEVHVLIGADPGGTSPELDRHLQGCGACRDYRQEMQQLDAQIHRALNIDVAALRSDATSRPNIRLVSSSTSASPPTTTVVPPSERPSFFSSMGRQMALAASVLFAVVVGFVLWGALPSHTLAADVVAHVISEPLPALDTPVTPAALEAVLRNANFRLDRMDQDVVFAQTCFFRGRLVPHFVVRTGGGAVTILVLPDEVVRSPEHIHDSGFNGVLYPNAGHGSIAVLSRAKVDSEEEARHILTVLHLEPPAA